MSLVKGVGASAESVFLLLTFDDLAHNEDMAHAVYATYDRGRLQIQGHRPWWCADLTLLPGSLRSWLAVGEYGEVLVLAGQNMNQEHILGPDDRGPLRGARLIGDSIYAVGADLQVYRRDAGCWRSMGPDPRLGRGSGILEAIDGFSNRELYASGWKGEIWRYQRDEWRLSPTPTNLILSDICCAGDGRVYACGQGGLIVHGRDDQWSVLDIHNEQPDLWSICWFKNRIFIASMQDIYLIEGGKVLRTDAAEAGSSFYDLSVAGDTLWSIGAKDLLRYDGIRWERIEDVEVERP